MAPATELSISKNEETISGVLLLKYFALIILTYTNNHSTYSLAASPLANTAWGQSL